MLNASAMPVMPVVRTFATCKIFFPFMKGVFGAPGRLVASRGSFADSPERSI
jgi:hypothetical protein